MSVVAVVVSLVVLFVMLAVMLLLLLPQWGDQEIGMAARVQTAGHLC